MIDWSALVADSAPNLPNNEAKAPCSDPTCRSKHQNSENVGTLETLVSTGIDGICSDIPTVPNIFERARVEESENSNPMAFFEPAGGGAQGQSAPHKTPVEPACRTCTHRRRPGLSDGYCGERADLPPAYTHGHPLRKLPDDGGASCPAWQLHPYM